MNMLKFKLRNISIVQTFFSVVEHFILSSVLKITQFFCHASNFIIGLYIGMGNGRVEKCFM